MGVFTCILFSGRVFGLKTGTESLDEDILLNCQLACHPRHWKQCSSAPLAAVTDLCLDHVLVSASSSSSSFPSTQKVFTPREEMSKSCSIPEGRGEGCPCPSHSPPTPCTRTARKSLMLPQLVLFTAFLSLCACLPALMQTAGVEFQMKADNLVAL